MKIKLKKHLNKYVFSITSNRLKDVKVTYNVHTRDLKITNTEDVYKYKFKAGISIYEDGIRVDVNDEENLKITVGFIIWEPDLEITTIYEGGDYSLYLDDVRDCPDGFILARSMKDAISIIEKLGFPKFISFDHDLGDSKANTGMDFAKWIVQHDMDNQVLSDDFNFKVHSANPVGAENIEKYLTQYLQLKLA